MPDKKIELVVFDFDGTLTHEPNSWGLIHKDLGVHDHAKKNADLFFANKIDYLKWAELDINLWKSKKLHYSHLMKVIKEKIKAIDGAKETIRKLKENKIKTLVISSGLDVICDHFKEFLDFDEFYANKLVFDENKILKGIEIMVGFNKDDLLLEFIKKEGISIDNVVSVGDNINDVQLFNITPISIAINPKDNSIIDSASHTIYTEDLQDILDIIL
jgi:phosphoserine phosphatase